MKKKEIFTSVGIAIVISFVMIFFHNQMSYKENKDMAKNTYSKIEDDKDEELKNEDDKDVVVKKNEAEEKSEIVVYISGEVKNEKVLTIDSGSRLVDAVNMVGGLTKDADTNAVNLALKLQDEGHYIIPKKGEALQNTSITTTSSENSANKLVNINTADKSTLTTLPAIGDKTAEKIINYRQSNGNFKSIEDIKSVGGIGEKKYEQIKDFITVN